MHKEALFFDIYDSFTETFLAGKCAEYLLGKGPPWKMHSLHIHNRYRSSEVSPLIYICCVWFGLCFPVNISDVYKYIEN